MAEAQMGIKNHNYGKTGENHWFWNKPNADDIKKKISLSRKGKLTGDVHPSKRPEIREKISIANTGKKHCLESKIKNRDKKKHLMVPIVRVDINTKEEKFYNCVKDAERDGFNRGNINSCLSKKKKQYRGFFWVRVEKDQQ